MRNGDSGAVACDFYHRYRADIALMGELGIDGFRFSVAWPRVLPEGTGRVNAAGLDFYDRLVDALLEAGIRPMATLYHWDLPQALEERGGWPARDTVDAFARYAEVVAGRLGDRVRTWVTHNEPGVSSWLGYGRGEHAPGRASERDALAAAHHLLLSHGRAVEVLRREAPAADVGITLNLTPVYPASPRAEDAAAARDLDASINRWFLDPIFHGRYPADALTQAGPSSPRIVEGDLPAIAAPLDFLGVNYYTRLVVAAGPGSKGPAPVRDSRSQYTDMGWEVCPDAFYDVLVRLRDEYAPRRIHVTENGAAFADVRVHDGSVPDAERQAYLESHLEALGRALEAGVPVAGYYVWSLLDNFEWAHGYSKRFGLVYVDYPTLERVPKGSFSWYRDFIAACRRGQWSVRGSNG